MAGIIISLLVFLAVFLGIFAVNFILTDIFMQERSRRRQEIEDDLRVQMRRYAKTLADQGDLQNLVESEGPQPFSVVDLVKKIKAYSIQAGMQANTEKLWFFCFVSGAALGVVTYLLTNSLLFACVLIVIGLFAPVIYIVIKRNQRQAQLSEQLPEALDLMSRVLRAGQTIPQAMNAVADEFGDPVGTEFGFCYEQQNLGLSEDVAMQNFVDRTGLMEIKILVMGMLIQKQSGGNLAELLDKLAKVMRQRNELKGMVKGLTAEGRMQAMVLLGLPFFAFFMMLAVNRDYAIKLLDHPALVYGTIAMMVVGAVWIRKIVNFDY